MATEADIEQVEILCAFRGETGPQDQRSHITHGAEVKGHRSVVFRVAEKTVAEAAGMLLKRNNAGNVCVLIPNQHASISDSKVVTGIFLYTDFIHFVHLGQ